MTNVNIEFCRTLLSMAMQDVKPVTTAEQRKGAWVYKVMDDHWEFHGPSNFYWHGSADNAYDARAKGWHAWLEKQKCPDCELPIRQDALPHMCIAELKGEVRRLRAELAKHSTDQLGEEHVKHAV